MATIKDVAKRSGVSVGTISRYLNGNEIKEENKKKIDETIKELNYKLNPVARCLRTKKTNTIGVIIRNLSDVFTTNIVKNIEQHLYKHGYNIVMCSSLNNPELEKEKVDMLIQNIVDGIIIDPCSENVSYFHEVREKGIPVVTIDIGVKSSDCDQVLTDNINATYRAVEYLINNNHSRIGIITGSYLYFTARERLKGYERVLEDYSIEIDKELIKTIGFSEESAYESFVQLMKLPVPPSAVITSNYTSTIGVIKAVYDMGIKVPDQLSIVGFDNIGLTEIVQPPLTIVVQPMDEIGIKAAELILSRVRGDYSGFPTILRLKPELVVKKSVKRLFDNT
jgi:LacI family transcriptional regulator